MAETVDELTINYEEEGILTTKELDKNILTKGAWCTIIFRYCVWDYKEQQYGPDRYTIRRYQKRSGYFQQRSKFNISSRDQAGKIVVALQEWLDKAPDEDTDTDTDTADKT